MDQLEPHFAVHCEMQDAAALAADTWRDSILAATVVLAKLLTRFEDQINDDDRHQIIQVAGGLIRADKELD